MLFKTQGIVLNYLPYRETSIICRIYTEKFGLQSYIENGVRSSKGKGKIALFQPLTLVDMVVYHNQKTEIQRISEIRCTLPYYSIPTDIRKTTLAIFISEVLSLTLKEHTENNSLFKFLADSLVYLENQNEGIENFHLFFLIHYSSYLGFAPEYVSDINKQMIEHGVPLSSEEKLALTQIIKLPFGSALQISKTLRLRTLSILIDFYRINIDSFNGLKSFQILTDILL